MKKYYWVKYTNGHTHHFTARNYNEAWDFVIMEGDHVVDWGCETAKQYYHYCLGYAMHAAIVLMVILFLVEILLGE